MINYGPKLKTKEYISGRMSDILSDLYKCYSIYWLNRRIQYPLTAQENNKSSRRDRVSETNLEQIEKYCINNLHNKIIDNINLVLNDINSPVKYLFEGVFSNKKIINSDKDITFLSNLFLEKNNIKDILTENVFIPNDKNDIRYKLLNHNNDDKIKEEIIKVN